MKKKKGGGKVRDPFIRNYRIEGERERERIFTALQGVQIINNYITFAG